MRDHSLIGKFICLWPTEKALHGSITTKWKPKGHIILQLGPKGFFTVISNCLEDRNRVLDGGPYFFNAVGLYLRGWIEHFNSNKEDLSWAPVWLHLYSLPLEYSDEDSLQDIGNGLGEFIKVEEETNLNRYTSYVWIFVYMYLRKALSDVVSLYHDDYEWLQTIDYEHVPFRCRKCHALGHLFQDCPSNKKSTTTPSMEKSDPDGFTKVPNRKKTHKKPSTSVKQPVTSTSLPSTTTTLKSYTSQRFIF